MPRFRITSDGKNRRPAGSHRTAGADRDRKVESSSRTDAERAGRIAPAPTTASSWTAGTIANELWDGVIWSTAFNRYVAISRGGASAVGIVATSPDGFTWTSRTASSNNSWTGIAEKSGVIVVVGTSSLVAMRSTDGGITWSDVDLPGTLAQGFVNVAVGNGLFVAIKSSSTNRIITSPDGLTWTERSAHDTPQWNDIASNGASQFVAVGLTGGSQHVMTSNGGTTWALRTTPDQQWVSVAHGAVAGYANGVWVAVAQVAAANGVMTSIDNGVTWVLGTIPARDWSKIVYANGMFVAMSRYNATGIATSPDGFAWTAVASTTNFFRDAAYSPTLGRWVVVARTGTGNRVMTAP